MSARPRVVIIGGGFAGLYAAKELRHAALDVHLVDQHNYHTFQPLLYQVATAQLETDEIARAVRAVFQSQGNFRFHLGTVTEVDWDAREVLLRNGSRLPFDFLIVGAGAIYNDFGIPGVRKHGFFLKSLTEAVNIRSHVLRQFERASAQPELLDEGILNFVIVGGGPTGVEMAGAMTELFDRVLPRDFPELDVSRARVILLEMADSLLLPYTARSQRYAERVLRRRGVDVRLGTAVSEVREGAAVLKDGEAIPTKTLIWAAGVRAHPLVDALDVELTRGYRIRVESDLSIPGRPYAFVAGDAAGAADEDGNLYPQVAQVAIQQGKHAARQIMRRIEGLESQAFTYADRGTMAIIGRNAGVAELARRFGGLRFRGFLGWLAWLLVHLAYLPGHQNRFNAILNWSIGYLTFDRHARLITEMVPSPGEIANRTSALVDEEDVSERRENELEMAQAAVRRGGASRL